VRSAYAMHLSSYHVALVRGEFQVLESFFLQSDFWRRASNIKLFYLYFLA